MFTKHYKALSRILQSNPSPCILVYINIQNTVLQLNKPILSDSTSIVYVNIILLILFLQPYPSRSILPSILLNLILPSILLNLILPSILLNLILFNLILLDPSFSILSFSSFFSIVSFPFFPTLSFSPSFSILSFFSSYSTVSFPPSFSTVSSYFLSIYPLIHLLLPPSFSCPNELNDPV